jgi:hypothetical protein
MAEEQISLPDNLAAQYGFAPASTEQAEAKTETPAAEATPAITPPAVEKPAESGVTPKVAEVAPGDGGKPLYTPEEIEEILKADGTLDSSRLDAQGKLLQKSFQRGTTPKFEQASKMREEALKIRAEADKIRAEYEQAKRDAENKRIFDKEAEELGEDRALELKEKREILDRMQRLEYENRQVKQREAGMQILNEYSKVSPKFHIPPDEDFTNMILGSIVGNDIRKVDGYPQTIEESTALFADKLGFTNVENLWKIIRANPENETAVRNFYINQHIKDKAKGPTVSPSSVANVQAEIKPPVDNSKRDIMDAVREYFKVPAGEEIKLTNN